jgi:hypothetical protein
MATITTSTFLDTATGTRTAGEAWTMNDGAVLTIRTDTRWHAKSPASMTGSIGATTISATQGGGLLIDSTNVRWMPYDSGSGNVPAINTSITQGGVTGTLLGVWSSYTSAPTAVGAAMPATGYIKFLEVTGGTFAVGALTGIGASATAPDRQGWIEIVQRTAVANTVPRLGYFRTRGGWFVLDQKTSGSANDVIQIPTNGGGANTHVAGVWIETDEDSDEWEFYPAIRDTWFLAANLSTDIRSKFVQTLGSGQVRIGYDGTANAGFVPPANCRIRIPSNIGRQSSSAGGDANNLVPHATLADRPDWTTTTSGVIDLEYFLDDWYHLFTTAFQVTEKNCATFDIISTSNNAAPITLENVGTGAWNGTSSPLTLTSNSLGGSIKDCKFYRANAASNGHVAAITTSNDYVFDNVEAGVIQYARSTGRSFSLSQCINLTFNNCSQVNAYFQIATCFGTRINNFDHTDRFTGVTNATTGIYCIAVLTSSDDTKVDGLTFGKGGVIPNVNSYLAPFYSINSSNTIFRNAGTRTAPLSVQAGFAPIYACHDAGVNTNLKFQRVYLEATRTSNYLTVNTSKNVTFESISGTVGSVQTLSLNTLVKGIRTASNSVTGGAAVYGSHVFDLFESDTVGRIWWAMNEPTSFSNSFVTLTLAGAAGGFTSAGQVSMQTVDDELIIETPYYILGHTGFANAAATLTGTNTGNFTYEYDIDVNSGTGFTGTYKTLDGANLSAETVSASLGFKLRLRITCVTGGLTNAITYVRINTTSTALAQDNLYPLDTAKPTVELTGLEAGTTVVVFDNTYTTELDRKVLTGDYTYTYDWIGSDFDVKVLVWKNDKIPYIITVTLSDENQSIPLNQSDDLVYGTAATNATINFASKLIIMNGGEVEYDVQEIYSLWKDQLLLTTNAQYDFAFSVIGGNLISGSNYIPFYTYLANGWKVRPDEANHTLNVVSGILLVDGGGDPFADTIGAYRVRVNYQQPVQAIAVSTSGGGGATPAEVWGYSSRTLSTSGVSAIQSGLATSAEITALNDISPAEVNAEVASALATYDPPTRAEATSDKEAIQSDIAGITGGLTTDEHEQLMKLKTPSLLIGGEIII